MPSSPTPGSSTSISRNFDVDIGLRRMTTGSALPILPQSVPRGWSISWLYWFASATACQVARPPVRIRLENVPSLRGLLLPGLQRIATVALGFGNLSHKIGLHFGATPETGVAAQAAVFCSLTTLVTLVGDRSYRLPPATWRHSVPAALVLICAFLSLCFDSDQILRCSEKYLSGGEGIVALC